MRKMLGITWIVLLSLTMTSCASMMGTSAGLNDQQIERICSLWIGVTWSDEDTDETITDAKVNNAKRDMFCGESK